MRKKPGDATRLKMVIGMIHTLMALAEVGMSMATDLVSSQWAMSVSTLCRQNQ